MTEEIKKFAEKIIRGLTTAKEELDRYCSEHDQFEKEEKEAEIQKIKRRYAIAALGVSLNQAWLNNVDGTPENIERAANFFHAMNFNRSRGNFEQLKHDVNELIIELEKIS